MGKWNFRHEGDWRFRVRCEARKLAIRATQGELIGPALCDAIYDLAMKAVETKPDTAAPLVVTANERFAVNGIPLRVNERGELEEV